MNHYKIAVWDSQQRFIDSDKAKMEYFLKKILSPQLIEIDGIANLGNETFDLLIASANHLDSHAFVTWMNGLCKKMESEHIWTPALIMRSSNFDDLVEVYEKAAASNWYFDIIDPDHLESLPLRIANLLRIHDHIKELKKYDIEVSALKARVDDLETSLKPSKS